MNTSPRRVLASTTRQNIDPSSNRETIQLRDEIALLTIDFNQTIKVLKEKVEQSEEKVKQLEKNLSCEIEYTISCLLSEMVQTVDGKNINEQKKREQNFEENTIQNKKPRSCD